MNYKAYLIVICDSTTNAVLSATVWSSPEWEQSRYLDERTFVAFAVGGKDYAEAKRHLIQMVDDPRSRYHWLCKYFDDRVR